MFIGNNWKMQMLFKNKIKYRMKREKNKFRKQISIKDLSIFIPQFYLKMTIGCITIGILRIILSKISLKIFGSRV
jgi:triosephosphate isomerase